jgi:DNA polymerase-1
VAEERRNLYLVDGSGYVFRAFFGLPPLSNSRGEPTGAIYGFIRMLFKLLKDARPTDIAVVFDSAKKTFRDDLFVDYKANRVETPNDLIKQIPFIHRAVDAIRIRQLVIDGYEADDVIGTLATRAARDRFNVVIVTGDKDFMQLVGPNITLWDTMFGKRTGAREVREKFGVEPRTVIDIMALMGDAIDNVKGVPGVGEKTASALIQHFGSLDALYAGLHKIGEVKARIPKKMAGVLADHRADAELSRQLVTINTDVPLEIGPADLTWPGVDETAAAALLRELEFGSLLAELAPNARAARAETVSAESVVARAQLETVFSGLRKAKRLAFNLSRGRASPRAAANDSDEAGSVVLKIKGAGDETTHVFDRDLIPAASAFLAESAPTKACHDLKRHITLLRDYGAAPAAVDFDTQIAGFLINPGKAEPSLSDLYHEHLALIGGNAAGMSEPAIVEALAETLSAKLAEAGLAKLYAQIELPVASVLAAMEQAGIGVDAAALRTISSEFGVQLAILERECFRLAGREFNLNSPIQLRTVLFDELKLSAKGLKKTKSGFSTDVDTLEKLAATHPLPKKLIEYRTIAKLKSTYSDSLPELINPATGRIHTSFHQALVATGRVSSTDPNLQNIPTRSEEGRRIRRAFVPAPGFLFLSADYSQIELRVLADLSGDATLVEAFARDEDIHARTAAEVMGASANDSEARRLAKVINFGIIYGMGPQRLASELGIPFAEASDYIKRYFERLPGVKGYLDETLRAAREHGYVTTMYGRRRYLPELTGPDGGARAQAERIAINTPIQGSAADLIKLAMVRLYRTLVDHDGSARIILQVHDELLLEVKKDALATHREIVRHAMEGVAELKVPLKVELKRGPSWAELERL